MDDRERKLRRNKSRKDAIRALAKTEQLNFRLEAGTIERIYEVAAAEHMHVGSLVRQWVKERLEEEDSNAHLKKVPAVREGGASYDATLGRAIGRSLRHLEEVQVEILEQLHRLRAKR